MRTHSPDAFIPFREASLKHLSFFTAFLRYTSSA
jgi:hypothetical protein